MTDHETVSFVLGGQYFEYDQVKQEANLKKHGIPFRVAARVFFDENYIEAYDDDNLTGEPRYDVIGDASVAGGTGRMVTGNIISFKGCSRNILYVVYTERTDVRKDGRRIDVIRLISARRANDFERGMYYGKVY